VIPILSRFEVRLPALSVLLIGTALAGSAAAGDDPALACPKPSLAPSFKQHPDRQASPLIVKARSFDAQKGRFGKATGAVELERADQKLSTDLMHYDPDGKTVTVPGELLYRDAVMNITSNGGNFSFLDDSGHFTGIGYSLVGSNANGEAADLDIESADRSVLTKLSFSTCPGDEPEWVLSAKKMTLKFDKGTGTARSAKLRFFKVPILYLPYISFPITNKRKSGFLYPYLATANNTGAEIGVPYYWNIAPNQDATLTPRLFSNRGAMLTSEYRFLTRRTRGELNGDYLPNDTIANRDRYHYKANLRALFSSRWRSRVLVERVGDKQYFQDFGSSLAETSRQYLRSRAGIYGSGRTWALSLIADDFQVVDEAVRASHEPYRRLPRLTFDLDQPLGRNGLRLRLDSEVVNFDRDIGATGTRLDLLPRLEWNIESPWGYIRPSAGYRYTSYDLKLHGLPGDSSPDRRTEILSLDAGLFMDRERANGNLQTLEPRLFYLYVPYKNQDDLPDFDAAPFTFSFSQLFHSNRFTGADRQSDANQITFALTTRTINQRLGHELWSLSLGQIVYLREPRLVPDLNQSGDEASPFIAELAIQPSRHWRAHLGAQWNWQNKQLDVAVLGITHRAANGLHVGAEYRFRRDSLDQFDLRYWQPINERWRVLSRLNYSLRDSDLLTAEAGFEYDSCCWALSLVTKRYLRNRAGDFRNAIYLQLQLKGLASLGRREEPLFYDLAQ
jgi:LPS-assembly protein